MHNASSISYHGQVRLSESHKCREQDRHAGLERDDIFHNMFAPSALALAQDYLDEEARILDSCLAMLPAGQFSRLVVVGGASLWYLGYARRYAMHYTLVEPAIRHLPWHSFQAVETADRDIIIIPKVVEEVERDEFGPGRLLFLFPFNVVNYMEIESLIERGIIDSRDGVIIACWKPTLSGQHNHTRYLAHIHNGNRTGIYRDGVTNEIAALQGAGFVITQLHGDVAQVTIAFGPAIRAND